MSKPDLSKMHRSELEAMVVDMAKAVERHRRGVANIVRAFEDEGDRVYLGSTNDADELRAIDAALTEPGNWLECRWMHGHDLWAEIAEARQQARIVREAISALHAEPVYEGGKKDNGIAVRFLARMSLLRAAAGLIPEDDPFAIDARRVVAQAIGGEA